LTLAAAWHDEASKTTIHDSSSAVSHLAPWHIVELDPDDVSSGVGYGLDLPAATSPAAERAFPPCTASHERAISSRVANQTPSNPFA
jgi:hypothetical protein